MGRYNRPSYRHSVLFLRPPPQRPSLEVPPRASPSPHGGRRRRWPALERVHLSPPLGRCVKLDISSRALNPSLRRSIGLSAGRPVGVLISLPSRHHLGQCQRELSRCAKGLLPQPPFTFD